MTLFPNEPIQLSQSVPVKPPARDGRQSGLAYREAEHKTVAGFVLGALWTAGKHGLTIQELAPLVTQKRGRTTKETSLTQCLKDQRIAGHVVKTEMRRANEQTDGETSNTIFVHGKFWTPDMGRVEPNVKDE